MVHELGHAWDIHSLGKAHWYLRTATGTREDWGTYKPGGTTTIYGRSSVQEDWAESVAETVYNPPSAGGTGIDKTREEVVRKRAK